MAKKKDDPDQVTDQTQTPEVNEASEATTPSAETPDFKIISVKTELEIMDRLGIDTLYKNSKGEYFTAEGLAVYSEGGKKENVSAIHRSNLETIIKSLSDAD